MATHLLDQINESPMAGTIQAEPHLLGTLGQLFRAVEFRGEGNARQEWGGERLTLRGSVPRYTEVGSDEQRALKLGLGAGAQVGKITISFTLVPAAQRGGRAKVHCLVGGAVSLLLPAKGMTRVGRVERHPVRSLASQVDELGRTPTAADLLRPLQAMRSTATPTKSKLHAGGVRAMAEAGVGAASAGALRLALQPVDAATVVRGGNASTLAFPLGDHVLSFSDGALSCTLPLDDTAYRLASTGLLMSFGRLEVRFDQHDPRIRYQEGKLLRTR